MTEDSSNIMIFSDDRFEPCRVCGEPSSGWHCGAVTCEACKKFFLRSINGEDSKYKCIRNQDCVIMRNTRTQCQYCRFQKCKEVGMTNNENPNNPTVAEIFKGIACQVCRAPSSGLHFGAITCEGCKGFFRRSIKERAPEKYRCMDNGNCEISTATRNMCRYCRYQLCLKAGMSAKNSRIGRQSNLFKHNIMEWQNKGAGIPNYLIFQRKIKKPKGESNDEVDYINLSLPRPISQTTQIITLSSVANSNNYDQVFPENMIQNQNNSTYNNNYKNGSYSNWQANNSYNQNETISPMDASRSVIDQAFHQQSTSNSSSSIEDTLESDARDLIKIIHRSFKCYLSNLSVELIAHLAKTFHTTNINNQTYPSTHQPQALNEIMECFRFYGRKLVGFVENFPGLGQVSSDDKEELVKCSIHSVILLSIQRKCDHYNYLNTDPAKFETFLKIIPVMQRSVYYIKSIHEKFEKFKLDEKEYALYSGLLVLSTATKYLKNYDKIMEIKESIGSALRQYMFARRNEEITCDEILVWLVYFRKMNSVLQKGITFSYFEMLNQNPQAFNNFGFFSKVFLPHQNELKTYALKGNQ